MRQFSKLLLVMLCAVSALATAAGAQQVTTEMIGPLTGGLTISMPVPTPICPAADTVTFTGNIHVVATVDTTANTVDYHINLLSVKGRGTLVSKYIANGATDLLDQAFPVGPVHIAIRANLFPVNPCRAGFPSEGALPIVVTVSFGADFTLNTVSSSVGNLP